MTKVWGIHQISQKQRGQKKIPSQRTHMRKCAGTRQRKMSSGKAWSGSQKGGCHLVTQTCWAWGSGDKAGRTWWWRVYLLEKPTGIVMIWLRGVGSLGQDVCSSHWEIVGFLIGLTSESRIFVDTLEVRQRKKEELKIPPIPYLEQKLLWMELNFQQWFFNRILLFSSVQFSHSVVSNSLWPHGLQHARPLCLSLTPRVYSNSCPLSRWCHPTISSSVVPFSSCPQSFPASGSFQISQLFTSGGQSFQVSASASVLPMNTQDWSPLV